MSASRNDVFKEALALEASYRAEFIRMLIESLDLEAGEGFRKLGGNKSSVAHRNSNPALSEYSDL
jgi:hypothetical protein